MTTEGNLVDMNSSIEVYNDPLAYKGLYENIVLIKDFDLSIKMAVLANNTQWI